MRFSVVIIVKNGSVVYNMVSIDNDLLIKDQTKTDANLFQIQNQLDSFWSISPEQKISFTLIFE